MRLCVCTFVHRLEEVGVEAVHLYAFWLDFSILDRIQNTHTHTIDPLSVPFRSILSTFCYCYSNFSFLMVVVVASLHRTELMLFLDKNLLLLLLLYNERTPKNS